MNKEIATIEFSLMAFNFIFAIFHCKYFSHLLIFFSVREKMNPFTLRFVESDCEFQVKTKFSLFI